MDDLIEFVVLGLGAAVVILALSALLAVPVWLLWNAVVPSIFGLPVIGFWQALGLNILCGFLFKSPTSSSKK